MGTINFGIIGCGGISNVHLSALSRRDDARVVCVADVNPEAARRQAETYGVPNWVTDYRDLIARPDIQAVVICTPTYLHADPACAAAEAGKHVLCEKPIALAMADADRMIAASETAGTLLMVAFVRRFCNEWLKFREIVQEGRLGRPVVWRTASASSGPASPWFMDAEKGGGPFIDGCVHDYDFARFTFGEPEKVVASLIRMKSDSTALDTGTAIIKFRSGDEVVRTWSWGLPGPRCSGQSMQDIIGPRGSLRFPGAKAPHFTYMDGSGTEHAIEFVATGGQEWFDEQMDHFVTCIREERQPRVTGEDGRKALEIGLAVLKAGATREAVAL